MENFDFKKVRNIMLLLDWKWYIFDSGKFDVPTIIDIKKSARRLLNDVVKKDGAYYSISTGGLKVEKLEEYIELSFNLTSLDSSFLNDGIDFERIQKIKKLNENNTEVQKP